MFFLEIIFHTGENNPVMHINYSTTLAFDKEHVIFVKDRVESTAHRWFPTLLSDRRLLCAVCSRHFGNAASKTRGNKDGTAEHGNKTSKTLPATHCFLLLNIKKRNVRDPVYKYKRIVHNKCTIILYIQHKPFNENDLNIPICLLTWKAEESSSLIPEYTYKPSSERSNH